MSQPNTSTISQQKTPIFNALVVPGLTYAITMLFISLGLQTRANMGTVLLSTTLWLFATVPLLYATGGDMGQMITLLGQSRQYFEVYGKKGHEFQYAVATNFYCVVLGTLIFSIYVPLDSETILQEWPIAPMTGACVGLIAGVVNGLKTIVWDKL